MLILYSNRASTRKGGTTQTGWEKTLLSFNWLRSTCSILPLSHGVSASSPVSERSPQLFTSCSKKCAPSLFAVWYLEPTSRM
jgi:hypothetical protein